MSPGDTFVDGGFYMEINSVLINIVSVVVVIIPITIGIVLGIVADKIFYRDKKVKRNFEKQ